MRYSIVQGPRQSFYNAYSGACRVFSLAFHQGQEPVIYEDGRQIRDFINIQDVVDANLLVLDDARADYEMFNVGGGKAITVAEFAATVAGVFGRKDFESVASGKYRFGDTRHIFSDIRKLQGLGWSPSRSTTESVQAYKEWLDAADSVADILDSCQKQMAVLNVVREVRKP
jgi:dTDP-L-rhamnose 4-epimerase